MMTKEKYESILEIRDAGHLNMNDVSLVAALADVEEQDVRNFRSNFVELSNAYGD